VDFHLNLNSEALELALPVSPLCVEAETSVRDAVGRMKDENRGAVLVCRSGVLVGIFTERDALRMMARGAELDVPMEEVMSKQPVSLSASDSMGTAIAKMSLGGYRQLPVVDSQGRPKGLVQASGILHYLVEHFPSVVYTLPPEPFHATHDREGA